MNAFVQTRCACIDYVDRRTELHIDTPTKVRLHLTRPNVSLDCDSESMRDPTKISWLLKTAYGGKHQAHGPSFERAQTKGEGQRLWQRCLDEAIVAIDGKVAAFDDNGAFLEDVPVEKILRELR